MGSLSPGTSDGSTSIWCLNNELKCLFCVKLWIPISIVRLINIKHSIAHFRAGLNINIKYFPKHLYWLFSLNPQDWQPTVPSTPWSWSPSINTLLGQQVLQLTYDWCLGIVIESVFMPSLDDMLMIPVHLIDGIADIRLLKNLSFSGLEQAHPG